jgi:hypothetical protein
MFFLRKKIQSLLLLLLLLIIIIISKRHVQMDRPQNPPQSSLHLLS